MRTSGERILGPYEQHNGWRVVRVFEDGTRKSRVLKSEKAAAKYIELLEAELVAADRTTESAFAEYRKFLEASGNKPESIDVVEWAVDLFFPSPVPLSLLSAKRCQSLYDEVRTRKSEATGEPLANDTHRAALSRAKQFLGWCCAPPRSWIKENPFASVKGIGKLRPRGKSLGKSGNELRVKEARAWYAKALELAYAGDHGATAGVTALLLGMRAGEVVARNVADLDEDTSPGDLLWIPCSKTPAGRRTLEIPEILRPLLLACAEGKEPSRPLFEYRGERHDAQWIRKQVHRICDLIEVPRVTAHAMRGLLATITTERGVAGHVIAATLGHESYEGMTLKAYAAPGSRAKAVAQSGLRVLNGGRK